MLSASTLRSHRQASANSCGAEFQDWLLHLPCSIYVFLPRERNEPAILIYHQPNEQNKVKVAIHDGMLMILRGRDKWIVGTVLIQQLLLSAHHSSNTIQQRRKLGTPDFFIPPQAHDL